MAVDLTEIKARRAAAQREKDAFKPLLDEAYEFGIPYRKGSADAGKGEKRVNRVFDSTAMESAFRFAGKFARDIFPPGFFAIKAGKWLPDTAREQVDAQTAEVSRRVEPLFLSGEWDNAVHEMGLDLAAGTAAMLVLKGDAARPARFITVPIDEVVLEGGSYNDVTGVFWKRKWTYRQIAREFPDGTKWSADLRKLIAEKPDAETELCQDTLFMPNAKDGRFWCRTAWCEDNKGKPLEVSYSRTCPWITPRYFRVPGETYGRGVLMLAMPSIVTLNVAQKIMLQAAAIAMLGIFTAVDDGVFNPDNSPLTPGTFWKVARNGGALGPSVMRFPDPRIDLSGIVVDKLQMAVKSAMNDRTLPPDSGAVRSPTEILERVKQLQFDDMGAFGRLVREAVVPVVKRVVEIAYDLGIIAQDLPIDDFLVRVEVQSPMAMAREQMKMQNALQYMQILAAGAPDMVDELVKRDKAMHMVAAALMVDPALIPSAGERKAIQEQKAAQQAAMVAAGALAGNGADAVAQLAGGA